MDTKNVLFELEIPMILLMIISSSNQSDSGAKANFSSDDGYLFNILPSL